MPWNGSGTFNRIFSWVADKAAGLDIIASRMDTDTNDIAAQGFGNCLTRDGQGQPTANLPMAGFRHTGVQNAVTRSDYSSFGQVQDGLPNWTIAGGSADAITATFTPALTVLNDGQLCFFRASAANATTTPTFSPNGLTARTITKAGGVAVVAGDIPGNLAEVALRYNSANTRWELWNPSAPDLPAGSIGTSALANSAVTYAKIQNETADTLLGNPTGSSAAPSEITLGAGLAFSGTTLKATLSPPLVPNFISGLTMSTAGSSGTMSIAAGVANDTTNATLMSLASAINKTTASWVVGTNNGGLDTGSIANGTWYHFYEIERLDTGVVDVIFSLSASAPSLPANYTIYRRIGSAKTDGSAHWLKFFQFGDEFIWDAVITEFTSDAITTTPKTYTLVGVPSGLTTITANMRLVVANSATAAAIALWYAGASNQATGSQNFALTSPSSGVLGAGSLSVRMDSTPKFAAVAGAAANNSLNIVTTGWIDNRGRQ